MLVARMLQINYSEIIVIVIMVIIIIVISSYNTSEIRGFLSDSLSQAWTFFFFFLFIPPVFSLPTINTLFYVSRLTLTSTVFRHA